VTNLHQIEPVVIERVRDHGFKRRRPKARLEKGQHDLCTCGYGKHNPIHHAFPESTNYWGSGATHGVYQRNKADWEKIFRELLITSSLPTGLTRVYVEARYTFGEIVRPDQDNLRYPCSKFLGDVLKEGWIPDDSWSHEIHDWQFEFGGLTLDFVPGLWKMELTIFPTMSLENVVERTCGVNPFAPGIDGQDSARDAYHHGVN